MLAFALCSVACVNVDVGGDDDRLDPSGECGGLPQVRPAKEPAIVFNTDTKKLIATWEYGDWSQNQKWQSVVDDYLECVRAQTSPSSR